MELALPAERYRRSYLEADQEFVAEGPLPDGKHIATEDTFAKMLDGLEGARTGERVAPGKVPMLELWLVDGDDYYGKVQIRRELRDGIRDHVGVAIRPSCRRRGLALQALELARPHILELGLDTISVVTSATNLPACALIAHFGGDMVEELDDAVYRFEIAFPP
jgi:predicted acetyltransferase